jgi:hypothetical protein
MIELAIQVFVVTVEVLFPKPRIFSKEQIDSVAAWLTSPETGFALRPEQVHLRTVDVAFEYELNAQLFGGNGAFALNAQKAAFAANNARSRADGDLLLQMIDRFLRTFAAPEKLMVIFSANAHAKLESAAVRQEYLERFRFDQRITGPGTVGYVRLEDWPEDVKLLVEPSLGIADSLFLAWTTKFSADNLPKVSDKFIGILESVAEIYGLKFKPLV